MKIKIIQNITKTFSEDRVLLATETKESLVMTPDAGKVLRNKSNGQIYRSAITVDKQYKTDYYEEIEEDEARK